MNQEQFTYQNVLACLAKQNKVVRLSLVHTDIVGYVHGFDDHSITMADVETEELVTYFMPHIISFQLA